MARTKSNGTNPSTATISFEAKLWLPTSTSELHPSNFASLPDQLFYITQIPVCLWFRSGNGNAGTETFGLN